MSCEAYPYVPGSHGVPFAELIASGEGSAVTGSGIEIAFDIHGSYFEVAAVGQPGHLVANVKDGILRLDLETIDPDKEEHFNPDFYAGKFVDFIFAYYKSRGVVIYGYEDLWQNGTNLDMYETLIAEGMSPSESANNTWSGIKMAQHGFKVISDADVAVGEGEAPWWDGIVPQVRAMFYRVTD